TNQLIRKVVLDLDPRRPTTSLAQVSDLAPGTYRARLQTPNLAMTQPLEAEFTIIAPLTAEMEELSSNPIFLQEIAAASGGQLLHLDEIAELPGLLKPFGGVTMVPREQPLWDRWPTLLLLTAIITVEWIIR